MRRNQTSHDALNDYLDAQVGTSVPDSQTESLDPGLRVDVDRFLDLARRANWTTSLPDERSSLMIANVFSTPSKTAEMGSPLPVSASALPGGRGWLGTRFHAGLSFLIVALMLTSIVGGAWWLGPGRGGGDDPVRLAALTQDEGTPEAYWPETLNPVDDPWIAAITPEECSVEPMSWDEYSAAAITDPGLPPGSFEVVGVPEPADADAAVTVLRSWSACFEFGNKDQVRTFYTSEYHFFASASMYNVPYRGEVERRKVKAELALTKWAQEVGLYPLSIISGVEPPPRALEVFAFAQSVIDEHQPGDSPLGGIHYSPDGLPSVYAESRFDPTEAVLLADGRIMIPTRYVYWEEDPWMQEVGFGREINTQSMALILKQVDGEWRIDETFSIFICAGGCDYSLIGTETWPSATPVP